MNFQKFSLFLIVTVLALSIQVVAASGEGTSGGKLDDISEQLSGYAWLKRFEERGTMMGKAWSEDIKKPMLKGAIFAPEETWLDKDDTASNNEPSIAANPTDQRNLVAAFHWYPDLTRGLDISIALYYTKNAGDSWTFSTFNYLLPTEPLLNYTSDPAVTATPDGVFIFSYMLYNNTHTALAVMNSNDGGVTWNGPYLATPITALTDLQNGLPFYDKEYIAADPNRPGVVYMSFTNFTAALTTDITVVTSNDYGVTWGSPTKLGVGTGQVTLQGSYPDSGTVGASDVAFIAWYNSTEDGWLLGRFEIWYSISSDGGISWSSPALAFNSALHNLGELSYYLCPSNAYHRIWGAMFPIPEIGPEGNIYILFSANNTLTGDGDCSDLFLVKSTNGGSTWSSPIMINDVADMAQYYGWIDTQDDGTIHAVWIDHRNSDPANPNLYYDAYYAYSTDEGDTWSANTRVTAASSISDDKFIGDYSNMAATDRAAYSTWAADRRDKTSIGDGEDDIYVARMWKQMPVGGIVQPTSAWLIPLLITLVSAAGIALVTSRRLN